ncbi:TPA: ArsB/NhaD family transporter [Clostridium botulinum]|uniref:ArsB/NhaD family transporter n=1 Tax=Clostridium botulinum TaxID=1491 RepID=UPI0015E6D6A0|nr:ArsB/NhaD family transporter [Clostridium botulinum]HDK7138688.1 ArsB/NhaD family transporter [Clostridium botulinum]HDK7142017.1 ArsB/NhaD family transporter [Clostridium botulinum]HDK7147052.1 ArsB/NhaD family transporter [Clostridium botulinum]HDK7150788.1 ArsB/NhaD family transporter [Clostridium botulinum]HDK7153290.1 ArsB/NhaD family transporter [Clostridium botulinum]
MMLPAIIFIIVYALIISEKVNRVVASLGGAAIMLILKLITQEKAFLKIDFNTIGLLVGMMIIVNITKRTGVFEYIAIKAAKFSKGNPIKILILFSVITAVLSGVLDNVTTVLLIVPVTLVITKTLEIDPIPFLMCEIFASNIGGTATLIGDPPNLMIGSAAGLSFLDFVKNLAPVIIIILTVTLLGIRQLYKNSMKTSEEDKKKIMALDESKAIRDMSLMKKCLTVLFLTLIGFLTHSYLGFESATISIAGSAILLAISKVEPDEILQETEWGTIFFFIGLFIMTGVLEDVGIMEVLAQKTLSLTKGNLVMTGIFVLWISAIASAFIDNIPFVATMIPLIKAMGTMGGMDIVPLWWALSLGACLGGNGTMIGASANLVVIGIAEKSGYKISFKDYFKLGFPVMLVSIIICTAYLLMFFLK